MVLWACAVSSPRRAVFPRQMGFSQGRILLLFSRELGIQKQGRRKDSKEGGPSIAEELCLLVEPSDSGETACLDMQTGSLRLQKEGLP